VGYLLQVHIGEYQFMVGPINDSRTIRTSKDAWGGLTLEEFKDSGLCS